jgi:hypothetical protein
MNREGDNCWEIHPAIFHWLKTMCWKSWRFHCGGYPCYPLGHQNEWGWIPLSTITVSKEFVFLTCNAEIKSHEIIQIRLDCENVRSAQNLLKLSYRSIIEWNDSPQWMFDFWIQFVLSGLKKIHWDFWDYVGRGEENFLCFNDRSGRIKKHENYIVGREVSMEWRWVNWEGNFVEWLWETVFGIGELESETGYLIVITIKQ